MFSNRKARFAVIRTTLTDESYVYDVVAMPQVPGDLPHVVFYAVGEDQANRVTESLNKALDVA